MRQTIAIRDSGLFDFPIVDDNFKVRDVINDIISGQISEDAFYVVDLGRIVEQFQLWKDELPRVDPFYAVKCNDSDCVLQVLSKLGVGFDCASKGEILKVKEMGVGNDRIIYANPCKSNSYIKMAAAEGVDLMTFDNETELYKIKQLHPRAKLVLRIRADAAAAQCPLGIKFGADLVSVPHLLAVAASLSLDVVGVSFHVGSGCGDLTAYPRAIQSSRRIFDLAKEMGFDFDLLDIGGGFPGTDPSGSGSGSSSSSSSPSPQPSFQAMAVLIRAALDAHFPEGCGVRIIGEPGRFFVAAAFTLATCVIGRRQAAKTPENPEGGYMYYVNDGVYGSFNCIMFDHSVVRAKLLQDYDEGTKFYRSSIWGPTCDSLDCIMPQVEMPVLNVGDWIMWPDMGAYTIAAASTFNGFPRSVLHPVIPRSVGKLLRDDDEPADYGREPTTPRTPCLRSTSQTCGNSSLDMVDELSSVIDSIAYIFPFEISIDA